MANDASSARKLQFTPETTDAEPGGTQRLVRSSATEREFGESNQTLRLVRDQPGTGTRTGIRGQLLSGEAMEGTICVVQSRLNTRSGEAEVYLGAMSGETVIVKYYRETYAPKDEVLENLKGISHPGVIRLLHTGLHQGRFFEVMQYAAGGACNARNEDGSFAYLPLKEDELPKLVDKLARALNYLHESGIIHRDLKPANILLLDGTWERPALSDFGISSFVDKEAGLSQRLTQSAARTTGYAAPELLGSAKEIVIGKQVDYYALGVVVFELLTGIDPFAGMHEGILVRDTISGRIVDDLLSRPESKSFSERTKNLLRGLLTLRHDKRWGHNEVQRWCKGESVEVYRQFVSNVKPMKVMGRELSPTEFAHACLTETDKTMFEKLLFRGEVAKWIREFDTALAMTITEITETYSKVPNWGLQALAYFLDPGLPFHTESGATAQDRPELGRLLVKERKFYEGQLHDPFHPVYCWIQGRYGLKNEIQSWLNEWRKANPNRWYLGAVCAIAGFDCFPQSGFEAIRKPADFAEHPEWAEMFLRDIADDNSLLATWFDISEYREFRDCMTKTLTVDMISGVQLPTSDLVTYLVEQYRSDHNYIRKTSIWEMTAQFLSVFKRLNVKEEAEDIFFSYSSSDESFHLSKKLDSLLSYTHRRAGFEISVYRDDGGFFCCHVYEEHQGRKRIFQFRTDLARYRLEYDSDNSPPCSIVFSDGSIYRGDSKGLPLNGAGVIRLERGGSVSVKEGTWKDDQFTGTCKAALSDGDYYEAIIENDNLASGKIRDTANPSHFGRPESTISQEGILRATPGNEFCLAQGKLTRRDGREFEGTWTGNTFTGIITVRSEQSDYFVQERWSGGKFAHFGRLGNFRPSEGDSLIFLGGISSKSLGSEPVPEGRAVIELLYEKTWLKFEGHWENGRLLKFRAEIPLSFRMKRYLERVFPALLATSGAAMTASIFIDLPNGWFRIFVLAVLVTAYIWYRVKLYNILRPISQFRLAPLCQFRSLRFPDSSYPKYLDDFQKGIRLWNPK